MYGKWGKGDPDFNLTPATVHKLERDIICISPARWRNQSLSGRDHHDGADHDYGQAIDKATYIHGYGKVLEKYLDYMREPHPGPRGACNCWMLISHLARELLKRQDNDS